MLQENYIKLVIPAEYLGSFKKLNPAGHFSGFTINICKKYINFKLMIISKPINLGVNYPKIRINIDMIDSNKYIYCNFF